MTRKVYVVELTEDLTKAASKRRRPAAVRRGAEFSDAWKMGKAVAGYGETSPIWGMTRNAVLDMIEANYKSIADALKRGDTAAAAVLEGEIALLKGELEKRKAARQIAWAANSSKKK